jgi:hypothetical protein
VTKDLQRTSSVEGPAVASWSSYSNVQSGYRLRCPPGWVVRQEGSDKTVLLCPGPSRSEFLVRLLPADAAPYLVPHLNIYLLRQYARQIGHHQAIVSEFRDTIMNELETRAVVPVEGKSYEISWCRFGHSGAAELDATLDTLVSNLEFLTEEHKP